MNSITVENAILLVKTPPLVKMWLEQKKGENANCYWKNHTQCCLLFVALLSLMIIGNKRNDLSSGKTNTRYDLRSNWALLLRQCSFLWFLTFVWPKAMKKSLDEPRSPWYFILMMALLKSLKICVFNCGWKINHHLWICLNWMATCT